MNPDKLAKEEEMLGRLLKLDRDAAPVPEMRQARARRAVQAHWRAQLVRRRRQRFLSLAAGLAVVGLSLGLLLRFMPGDAPIVGQVASVAGGLQVETPDEETVRLGQGSRGIELVAATTIRTGPDALAHLAWVTGHSVRLANATRLELVDARTLRLHRGAVYLDSGPVRTGEAVEVVTEHGVFREIGTRFMVSVDENGASVRVRDGKVALGGSGEPVAAGEMLTVTQAGVRVTGSVGPDDPVWDWTFLALGKVELEGRTLDDFLRWVAAENGWQLDYATPDIARRATRHTLSGALDGLTPDQALDAVLRTFGLRHSLEDGRLVISTDSA